MTSENRREVAERLREAIIDDGHADMPGEKRGFQVTLRRIIGTSNPTRPALYARLADLIDPTCEMKIIPKSSHCICSRCGAFVRRDAVTSCTEVIPVRHCPNCGARVVSE